MTPDSAATLGKTLIIGLRAVCGCVGLRAVCRYEGLRVVVVVGLRAVVNVGLRAVLFCKLWKPHRAGEVLPNFLTNTNLLPFNIVEDPSEGTRGPRSFLWALRVCLHRVASPLHRLDTALLA